MITLLDQHLPRADVEPGGFVARRVSELAGLAMMLFALALGLALVSWSPDDPSPFRANGRTPVNLLGGFGAGASDIGLQFLGLGYVAVIAALACWGWRLFTFRGHTYFGVRLLALLLAVISAAVAAAALPSPDALDLPAGPGGGIGEVLLGPVLRLGPLLGGVGGSTLGLIAGAITGICFFILIGTERRNWRGVAGQAVAYGKRAVDASRDLGRAGVEAARTRLESVSPLFARDPDEGAGGPAAPVGGGLHLDADDRPCASYAEPHRTATGETAGARREPALRAAGEKRGKASKGDGDRQGRLDLEPARAIAFRQPGLDLLTGPPATIAPIPAAALEQGGRLLIKALGEFGVRAEIKRAVAGPVVVVYEAELASGIKAARVIGLADDIARAMGCGAIRVAATAQRSLVTFDLPRQPPQPISFGALLRHPESQRTDQKLPLILGRTPLDEPVVADLARLPHLLLAGAVPLARTEVLVTLLLSLVLRHRPEACRLILIDHSRAVLGGFDGLPHLFTPLIDDPVKSLRAINWAVKEMEERYRQLSRLGVRNIEAYNAKVGELAGAEGQINRRVQTGFCEQTGKPIFEDQPIPLPTMPYCVLILAELADLLPAACAEFEAALTRLAQMGRAAGIHMIIASTQPVPEIVTPTIRNNLPGRLALKVATKVDSRTVLGETGAELMLGRADMLYLAPGGRLGRVHGVTLGPGEAIRVADFLRAQARPVYLADIVADPRANGPTADGGENDPLYDSAVMVVLTDRKCLASHIQKSLNITYNRAARFIERMELAGLVSPANHLGKREVLAPPPETTPPAADTPDRPVMRAVG